jgi:shikimate kinase
MSDYYEPHARIRLQKPIVLAGKIGCTAAAIARSLAGQTGLPFTEVDRLIEHEAGRSLARIAAEDGAERLTAWADSALSRIAGDAPFGLIVLDRAWPSIAARGTLRDRTHLVYVHRSREFLQDRLAAEVERAGDWILAEPRETAVTETGEAGVHARREPILSSAETVLEAGDLHAHRVAEMLLESLERIVELETL